MKKYKKILLASIISFASLSSLYAGALFAIPKFVDLNDYKTSVIEKVEKDKMEIFAKENPNIFMEMLPYAMVLEVSNIWIKDFVDYYPQFLNSDNSLPANSCETFISQIGKFSETSSINNLSTQQSNSSSIIDTSDF